MALVLDGAVAGWLRRLGVVRQADMSPYGESVALKREAAAEFENGVRVGRLLQLLGGRQISNLKELNTPVAKLYNWNALLPELKARGVHVDADMKVLIVAGDSDIVLDVVKQLHVHATAQPSPHSQPQSQPQSRAGRFRSEVAAGDMAQSDAPRGTPSDATRVADFLAVCLHQQLNCGFNEALDMMRGPGLRALSRKLLHGVEGDHGPVVRYLKLAFAHCRALADLCARDPAGCDLALDAVGEGLRSNSADVVLWSSRLLCRLASDLSGRNQGAALWPWFSRAEGGASALVEAWRAHPELHANGALLPVALHFSGESLGQFIAVVLPQHLAEPRTFLAFSLELLPLLSSTKGMGAYMAKSGALQYLVQRGLEVRDTGWVGCGRGVHLPLARRR